MLFNDIIHVILPTAKVNMGLHGGYRFKHFEGVAEPEVRELPIPDKVVLPFPAGGNHSFSPAVKKGDTVQAGDTVFTSEGKESAALVSPVNGTIEDISKDNGIITIVSDGTASFKPVGGHNREPWKLGRAELFSLFKTTGCSLLTGDIFSSPDECGSVKTVIVNAVHNSPLNQSWNPGMIGNPKTVSNGLKTLAALFPQSKLYLAINKKHTIYFDIPEITKQVKLSLMSDRYPQEHPELLAREIANKRLVLPEGAVDTSMFVLGFHDLICLAEAMTEGRPLIDRIIMAAGPGVSKPGWYRVRIGATFEFLKKHLFKSNEFGPWRIIRGNPLTGMGLESLDGSVSVSDDEITVISEHAVRDLFTFVRPGFAADSYSKTTVAEYINLLPKKLETNVHGGVRPCVQCNYCDEVCPVDIYPFLIWKHVEADAVEESFRFRPYDCIECGLCDYVCPSKIDIVSSVKKAKDEFRRLRRAEQNAD